VARDDTRRREALRLLGGAGAVGLLGACGRDDLDFGGGDSDGSTGGEEPLSCTVRPEQTEGPYFVDQRLERSDIRSDPTTGAVSQGVLLRVIVHVSDVMGETCVPIAGAVVDLWQCDAIGEYSGVADSLGQFDHTGRYFLRGFQRTDERGRVEFITVYPGWYTGRCVHLHFKVRTDPDSLVGREFTSQLYFDEAVTDLVHATEAYAGKGPRDTPNERDGAYRSGGSELVLAIEPDGDGWQGRIDLGLLA